MAIDMEEVHELRGRLNTVLGKFREARKKQRGYVSIPALLRWIEKKRCFEGDFDFFVFQLKNIYNERTKDKNEL